MQPILEVIGNTLQYLESFTLNNYLVFYAVCGFVWAVIDQPLYAGRLAKEYADWKDSITSNLGDLTIEDAFKRFNALNGTSGRRGDRHIDPQWFISTTESKFGPGKLFAVFAADLFFWPVRAPYVLLTDTLLRFVRFTWNRILVPFGKQLGRLYDRSYKVVFHIYKAIIRICNRKAIADFEKLNSIGK